jgi:hypothetical protein
MALVSTALFQLAFAQSKGAPVVGSGGTLFPVSIYGNVVDGPTVGPDGNAYLVRTTVTPPTSTTPATSKTELVSIGSVNTGKALWTLTIDGTYVSAPAFGGGLIFLTTSEPSILPLALTGGVSPVAAKQPALLIVSSTGTLLHTVNIAANTLSAPEVSADGQTIYVMAQTSPVFTAGVNTITPSTATLYAYSPAGTVKNTVKLF